MPVRGAGKTTHIETGRGAHGIAVSEDGSLIAVTNTYDNTLTVIDAASTKVLATLDVGAAPNGVTVAGSAAK